VLEIKKKYIVDENNKKLAVEIDIDTYNRIEEFIEDYGLGLAIKEALNEDHFNRDEALRRLEND
jgi:hypothetical protein